MFARVMCVTLVVSPRAYVADVVDEYVAPRVVTVSVKFSMARLHFSAVLCFSIPVGMK
jgi:hypothetical protein